MRLIIIKKLCNVNSRTRVERWVFLDAHYIKHMNVKSTMKVSNTKNQIKLSKTKFQNFARNTFRKSRDKNNDDFVNPIILGLFIFSKALTEERSSLQAKIKSLERELNVKTHKSERERAAEELRSKLKAAEAVCESLMDENEYMKKEIRELEEEIYEMQDNFRCKGERCRVFFFFYYLSKKWLIHGKIFFFFFFLHQLKREEQADEYTKLKKNLEQSNKNCRVLLFKLKRIERKAELLEADKTDLENKYEQVWTLDFFI